MTPEEEAAQASAATAEAEEAARAEQEARDLEEREPGGDSPEQIRARKEYRLRKKIEAEAQVEREKVIALEARVQTLQEVAERKPPVTQVAQPTRFTSAEAWQKVDAGEWTRENASEYIADNRYLANRNQEQQEEKQIKEILGPIEEAKKQVVEYTKLLPSLATETHPKWKQILASIDFYKGEDPRRTQVQAARLALREVLGSIEAVRENIRVSGARPSGDHHMETRGGNAGFGDRQPNKDDKYADIPQYTKTLWERTRTSEKDRETEAKFFRENRNKRRA